MQSYWIDEMADGCSAIRIIIKTETVTAQRMFHSVSGKRRYTGFTLIEVFTQQVNQLTSHQCISQFNQSLASYLKRQHQALEEDFSHRIRVFFLYHFMSSFCSFFFHLPCLLCLSDLYRLCFLLFLFLVPGQLLLFKKKIVNLMHAILVILLLCPSSFFASIPEM